MICEPLPSPDAPAVEQPVATLAPSLSRHPSARRQERQRARTVGRSARPPERAVPIDAMGGITAATAKRAERREDVDRPSGVPEPLHHRSDENRTLFRSRRADEIIGLLAKGLRRGPPGARS